MTRHLRNIATVLLLLALLAISFALDMGSTW